MFGCVCVWGVGFIYDGEIYTWGRLGIGGGGWTINGRGRTIHGTLRVYYDIANSVKVR